MAVKLTGVTWEHARGHAGVEAAAVAYRHSVPDVEISWEIRSLQAFADEPLERLAHRADLLVIDHPHIPHAAAAGLLARLDDDEHVDQLAELAAHSVGQSHVSYEFQGHQWGLAIDAAAQVCAYRPDLIGQPPGTWPEVLELARAGRVLWPYKPVDVYSSLITIAAGNGIDPLSTPGTFLPTDALAEALELLRRLAELVPQHDCTANPIDVADELSTSDRYAYSPLLFGYTNYSRAGFRPHRLRYADIPASRRGVSGSLLGGAGIVVSAFSPHRSAAIDYAFWVASAAVQEGVYYDAGGQPGNAVAWQSARTNADCLDFFTATRASLEGAYRRPQHPDYPVFQNEATELVHRAVVGRIDAEVLARQLDSAVGHHLED